MRVLLDEHPIEVEPATIARAIEVAREAAAERGRIVIEVLGDGAAVDPGLIDQPPADDAGLAELKLITAEPGAFVSVTLADAVTVLDEAGGMQQQAAEAIQAGRIEEALEPLRAALSAWAVIRDVVDKSSALLGIDPKGVETTGGTGASAIDGLAGRLGEIRRALTEQDYGALSDVLAYDMPEQVEAWRGLLGALESAARDRSG
jgi:hypothetical protein